MYPKRDYCKVFEGVFVKRERKKRKETEEKITEVFSLI